MVTICCAAGYGQGGLGRHLAELVESARAAGELERYFAFGVPPDDPTGQCIPRSGLDLLLRCPPIRFSPGMGTHLTGVHFDRAVAARLNRPPGTLIAFAGQALQTFRRAKAMGCRQLELVAANSHVNHLARQHARAAAQWKVESTWLNVAQCQRMRAEYEMADRIHVATQYVFDSFVREGIPPQKLVMRPLHPHPRFTSARGGPKSANEPFRVIYVGSLTVVKGLPVLLEAFRRLADGPAELVLVGGTATRPMRRYLQNAMRRDPRIRLTCGDPLPHLHQSDIFVHCSYEDGFGYAPMEALACGLPAIVTDQTGMKEFIRPGINGDIVPAGQVELLLERLIHWRKFRGAYLSAVPGR